MTTQHHSLKDIEAAVSAAFQIPIWDLHAETRALRVSRPRMAVYYLARQHTKLSLPQIGAAFGRDHTTVLYGARKIARLAALEGPMSRGIALAREILAGATPARERMAAIAALPLTGTLKTDLALVVDPNCKCGRGPKEDSSHDCAACRREKQNSAYAARRAAIEAERRARRARLAALAKEHPFGVAPVSSARGTL